MVTLKNFLISILKCFLIVKENVPAVKKGVYS